MRHPRVGVACIVQRRGKVLFGQRHGSHGVGSWGPPGGHLEFGERVEACAARELLEETGLKALSLQLGPWAENFMENGEKHYITLFVFIERFEGEPSLLEPHKCQGWEWHAPDRLPRPLFAPVEAALALDPKLFSQKRSNWIFPWTNTVRSFKQ